MKTTRKKNKTSKKEQSEKNVRRKISMPMRERNRKIGTIKKKLEKKEFC